MITQQRQQVELRLKEVEEDSILKLGSVTLSFMLTLGHTPGGICILVDNKALLTDDTLFIGNCGRADLPGGNINDLFSSLQRIKSLSGALIVYPGHDYGPKPFDGLERQKKTNMTLLTNSLDGFRKIS